jgi:kynurenine formamidase
MDVRHAWHVWGAGDCLGTLNHLTDEACLHALGLPVLGRRVNLNLPLTRPDPPLYRRSPMQHRVFERDRNTLEDIFDQLDPQSSSQWDSLRHIRARQYGFYGGVDDATTAAAHALGVHTMAQHGLVARGVLVDLPRYWAAVGVCVDPFSERAISAAELQRAAARQRVSFHTGDLLLVRTGWLRHYLSEGGVPEEHLDMPTSVGLAAGHATAAFLWDGRFAAVAADNPAVEVLPGNPMEGSLHRRLIPALGMPLGELWNLEELADLCAASGRYECCLVSVPLNVPGGVASPANALAVL